MTIQETIVARMKEAMRSRDIEGKDTYRLLKGKLDLVHDQPVPDAVASKMLRSLLADAKLFPKTFTPRDIAVLEDMVPKELDLLDTIDFFLESPVLADRIKECKTGNQAMGIAMKAFSMAGKPVVAHNVKAAIEAMRMPAAI